MKKLLVINGPNLNLLGSREPEHYGTVTLSGINEQLSIKAQTLNVAIDFIQDNSESVLINTIHQCLENGVDFILFNPAAFTHTSVALRDALAAVNIPFIEIHLSNIYRREPFRHHSYFSDTAVGVISGLGAQGYTFALQAAVNYLTT